MRGLELPLTEATGIAIAHVIDHDVRTLRGWLLILVVLGVTVVLAAPPGRIADLLLHLVQPIRPLESRRLGWIVASQVTGQPRRRLRVDQLGIAKDLLA